MGDRFTEKLHRSAVRTFPARLPPRPRVSFRWEAEEDPDLLRSPHEPSSESGEPPDPRPAPLPPSPRGPRRSRPAVAASCSASPRCAEPGPRERRAPPPRPSPRRPAAPPSPHSPAAAGPSATCPLRRRRRRGPRDAGPSGSRWKRTASVTRADEPLGLKFRSLPLPPFYPSRVPIPPPRSRGPTGAAWLPTAPGAAQFPAAPRPPSSLTVVTRSTAAPTAPPRPRPPWPRP